MIAHPKRTTAHLVGLLTLAMYPGCRPAPGAMERERPAFARTSQDPPRQSAFAPIEQPEPPRRFEPRARPPAPRHRPAARRQPVRRETRRFYGPSGFEGSSRIVGPSERFYSRGGKYLGQSRTRDGRTSYYGRSGYLGSEQTGR